MKVFVTNVFYDEEVKSEEQRTRYMRKNVETGELEELLDNDLIIRKSGTVILLAESKDTVLAELQTKVSDKIVEVEIVDEIDLEEQDEIQTLGMVPVGGQDDTQPLKGKIIFQSNI